MGNRLSYIPSDNNVLECRRSKMSRFREAMQENPTHMTLSDIQKILSSPVPPTEHLSYDNMRVTIDSIVAAWHLDMPDAQLKQLVFVPLWSQICAWISAILKKFVLPRILRTAVENKVLYATISMLWFSNCDEAEPSETFPFPAGFTAVIIEVCVDLLQRDHPCFELLWYNFHVLRKIYIFRNPQFWIIGHKYKFPHLLSRALKSIASKNASLDPHLLYALITITMPFTNEPSLRTSVISLRIIRSLGKAMHRFALNLPHVTSTDYSQVVGACALTCSILLHDYKLLNDGISTTIEFLDSHFLTVFTLILPYVPCMQDEGISDMLPTLCTELVTAIQPFLVYRSVLNRTLSSIKSLKSRGLLTLILEDNEFRKALETLEKNAMVMKGFMNAFDKKEGRKCCCNPSCPIRESDSVQHIKWKRCSGCLEDVYCSAECQRASWGSHRTQCHESHRRPNDVLIPRNALDEGFMHYLAHREAEKHRSLLRSLAARRDANSQVFVDIDFRAWPRRFSAKVRRLNGHDQGGLEGYKFVVLNDEIPSYMKLNKPGRSFSNARF